MPFAISAADFAASISTPSSPAASIAIFADIYLRRHLLDIYHFAAYVAYITPP